jgi:hypothetical protein
MVDRGYNYCDANFEGWLNCRVAAVWCRKQVGEGRLEDAEVDRLLADYRYKILRSLSFY